MPPQQPLEPSTPAPTPTPAPAPAVAPQPTPPPIAVPPPVVPAPPPVAPAPTVARQVPGVPFGLVVPTQPLATVQPKHHRLRTSFFVVIFLLLLVVGGVAYAYQSGVLALVESFLPPIPFLSHAPYDKTQVLNGVALGLGKISTSVWDVKLHVLTQPRDPGAMPFVGSSTQSRDYSSVSSILPASFDALLDINGAVQKTGDTSANARAALSFDLTSEDLSLSVAAEFRKVEDNFYAIVTKIPGLLGDFSAIKNKWVIITPADAKNYGGSFSFGTNVSQQANDQQQQYLSDLKTLLALENQDQVLTSADPVSESVAGQSLYRYDLKLNAAAITTFYSDAMNAFEHEASTTMHFDQSTLTYLQSAEGQRLSQYLAENLTVSIWVDKDGLPNKFEGSMRIVPGDDVAKLANKQIQVIGDLTLLNINQPVSIDAPSPTISADAAYALATGQTVEQVSAARIKSRDAKRVSDLAQIRLALERYKTDKGSYPPTTQFLVSQYIYTLPNDPVDNTPYTYTLSGSTYTLGADLENIADAPKTKGSTILNTSCQGTTNGRFCYRITPTTTSSVSVYVPPAKPATYLKPADYTDHILGNANAKVMVIEYSDLECPFCKIFQTTMHQVMNNYGASGNVAWVYRSFPLGQIHSKAPKEGEAAECAADQGGNNAFFSYIDQIYSITPSDNGLDLAQLPIVAQNLGLNVTQFNQCLNSGKYAQKMQTNYNEAIAAGAQGTPTTFIAKPGSSAFITLAGAQPYDSVKEAIDSVLAQ